MNPPDSFRIKFPRACHVVIEGSPIGVGLVHPGKQGYCLVYDFTSDVLVEGYTKTLARVRKIVRSYNDYMGITEPQSRACYYGAMHGWNHFGAIPESWAMVEEMRRKLGIESGHESGGVINASTAV